ncbi:MAG: hypothetical protein M3168_02350 [Actinomycetota bacterium]|nr:hypothetical protein [Actinomycetota bacterium]
MADPTDTPPWHRTLPYEHGDDEPVEVGRYTAALRRGWLLIALIVIPLTAAVAVLSLSLPETYVARAKIVLQTDVGSLGSADVESVQRQLATIQTLLTTRTRLGRAAARLRGETARTLEDKVSVSVDAEANLIEIVARDSDAAGAAAMANAVATVYLAQQRARESRRVARARVVLNRELARLRGTAGPVAESQRQDLRERLIDLSLAEARPGAELQLAERALPSEEPDSPRPIRNTIFAFFAAIFVAVLAALAREQLAPRIPSPRELARITGLPILAGVAPLRLRRRSAHREAYRGLAVSVARALPAAGQRVLLVTAAPSGRASARVAAALGIELARNGERTLVASANFRESALERALGVGRGRGVAELLSTIDREPDAARQTIAELVTRLEMPGRPRAEVDAMTSGVADARATPQLTPRLLDRLFGELAALDYDWIVVEGPPILGSVDAQLLAGRADGVVIVTRLDRLSIGAAAELREVSGPNTLGLVVLDAPLGPRVQGAAPVFREPLSGRELDTPASEPPSPRPS